MAEICGDNRFELIEKYKTKLIEATNIETAKDEMVVIDNILFRFWQMGWLDKLEADVVPKSEVEKFAEEIKLEFYREFDEIIPSIMADKIDELKKKYMESEDKK